MPRNNIWDQTSSTAIIFLETEMVELKITTFASPNKSNISLQN